MMAIMMSDKDYDISLSRRVIAFTHEVRSAMYTFVRNKMGKGLIIDVGVGRFQAASQLTGTGFSYIFCDPNLRVPKGQNLMRWMNLTSMSPSSLAKYITKASVGKSRNALFKGKLEELLNSDLVVSSITAAGGYVSLVYSMSLSHTQNIFNSCARLGWRQIGSCYVYDEVNQTTGVLCDIHGVRMRVTGDDENRLASVLFPGDNEYTEAPVTSDGFNSGNRSRPIACKTCDEAMDPIPLIYKALEPNCFTVCRHIRIFS